MKVTEEFKEWEKNTSIVPEGAFEEVKKQPVVKDKKFTNVYSFQETWILKENVQHYLINDLLPSSGVALLIGEDGIGKTQLGRELCLRIGFNVPNFAGQTLNIRYGSGIYLATEDSTELFAKAGSKQVYGMGAQEKITSEFPSIDFVEGTNYDNYKQLTTELEELLKIKKRDIVVIDAFSDLFTLIDGEVNSSKDARKLISPLQALANKYDTLFLILHHAGKSSVRAKREKGQVLIEKNDCQGASAITQKPRTVLALSNDPVEGVNYLHCVKANGLTKKFKETAIKLKLNEETLLHDFIEFKQVYETESSNQKGGLLPSQIDRLTHKELLREVFQKEQSPKYSDLVRNFKSIYSSSFTAIGDNKAKDFITYYKLNDFIKKTGQCYQLV